MSLQGNKIINNNKYIRLSRTKKNDELENCYTAFCIQVVSGLSI